MQELRVLLIRENEGDDKLIFTLAMDIRLKNTKGVGIHFVLRGDILEISYLVPREASRAIVWLDLPLAS